MARVLNVAAGSLATLAGLTTLMVGTVLIARREIDPVTAAMLGGVALAVFEGGAVVLQIRRVPPVGPGTFGERLLVLAGVELGAVVVGLAVAPASDPVPAGVVVGSAAIIAFATLVGLQARS
jgi:hypothetical protein